MPVGSRKSTVIWSRAWPVRGEWAAHISRRSVMAGGMARDTKHYLNHKDLTKTEESNKTRVQIDVRVFPNS